MVCRNICDRLYSKITFGVSNYSLGQKYCRRCEVYMYHDRLFCPCCGMQLRLTSSHKEGKDRLRQERRTIRWEMSITDILDKKSWVLLKSIITSRDRYTRQINFIWSLVFILAREESQIKIYDKNNNSSDNSYSSNVVYVCKRIHSNCIRVCDAPIRDLTKKKLAVQTSLSKPR